MIIIKCDDGTVSILHPTNPKADDVEVDLLIAKWESSGKKSVSWRRGTKSHIPTDRTFRNAWKDDSPRVSVDMVKARDIHMDRIRAKRDAKLAALDVDALKTLESGDATLIASVASKKQALRDIPQNFDLSKAKEPEALKKLWPTELD